MPPNEDAAPDEENDGPDIDAILRRLEQDIPNRPAPLLPIVCRALEEEGLTYSLDESSSSVTLAILGDEAEFSCFLRANDAFRMVVCLVRPPVWVPESARMLMCEAITLANYNLPFGNFEMDLEDGDLRFKTSIDVEGGELVTKMVQNLLGAGIAKANQYHPAFMRVMYGGVPPRDAIAEVEE